MAMGDMWNGGIQNALMGNNTAIQQSQLQNNICNQGLMGFYPQQQQVIDYNSIEYQQHIDRQQRQQVDQMRHDRYLMQQANDNYFGSQLAISSSNKELSNLEWLDSRIEEVSHKLS